MKLLTTLRYRRFVFAGMLFVALSCGTMSQLFSNAQGQTPPPAPAGTAANEIDKESGKVIITNPSGLKYVDLVVGKGDASKTGDHLSVNYIGKLADGKKFDSSYDRGQPFDVVLGVSQVIQGWTEGLAGMKPGGKRHPIDEVITDGDTVSLGGVTLTAHLTAGHTPGCTTWTTTATENGKQYDVVFGCSLRSPAVITPEIEAALNRSFKVVRALPCDIPLGDHPAEYRMLEKHARLQPGGPNPFIDKAGCTSEADIQEAMFHAILKEQATKH